MREILFRGKRLDNGCWITGAYHPAGGRHYIFPLALATDTSRIKVVPETVGQFTGLTDCGKRKLFEHDIVTAKFKSNGARYNFAIIFKDGGFLFDNGSIAVRFDQLRSVRKIGNIHDSQDSCEEIVLGSYDSEGNLEQSLRISADCLTLEDISGEKFSIYQGNALEDLAEMLGRR